MLIMKVQQLARLIPISPISKIQAMIHNDPRKSIRSIARDMRVPEFLIRQVVHEDIWYFLYKMRKGQFLITVHEGLEERQFCKAFQPTQESPSTEHALLFLRWEKFPLGSDSELTEQLLACSVPTRYTDSHENQTPSQYHCVWSGY